METLRKDLEDLLRRELDNNCMESMFDDTFECLFDSPINDLVTYYPWGWDGRYIYCMDEEPESWEDLTENYNAIMEIGELTNDGLYEFLGFLIEDIGDVLEEYIRPYKDNYYGEGSLKFGEIEMCIESVWNDAYDHINIHVNDEYGEGDFIFRTLSDENRIRIISMIIEHE